ncbi:sodium-independent sulfate anion transporter-like [Phlebotomus argentipes]|uniref:sodium-independent sulfate anion transporter-like n=1 Tax=Phlebotomus argentipes TaxID=94469 RepID=UPI002892A677|nr:sodium-independent sulfate anion transporter-like [Phlebotomus argentipes]
MSRDNIIGVTSEEDLLEDPNLRHREKWPDVKEMLRRRAGKMCRKETVTKRVPVLDWLPKYRREYVFPDVVAGITVALTAIPQGIAYAVVAGLEPQHGLYSELVPSFVYCVLGSCKDITIGPTAIMALLVQSHVLKSPDFAPLACFLTGIIILAMAILNLGFLVQFISIPVTVGFCTAAALTIASAQIKSLLGLPGRGNEFIESWKSVIENIHEIQLWDTILGVSSIILLLSLKKTQSIPKWKVFFKYVSISRNAIIVILGTLLAFLMQQFTGNVPFALTGSVAAGFPPFVPPPFTTTVGNSTLNFQEMIAELGTSIISIPVISVLEIVAVAKAFSMGKTVDATQEMIALGFSNVLASFVASIPLSGSFTRSALNNACGVCTTGGGILTGIIVLLAIGFLTSTFYYIPKASLAAVIMVAMYFMIDFAALKEIWRTRRVDFIPFLITLVACLALGVDLGIVIGIASNLVFIIYDTARPRIQFKWLKVDNDEILVVTPNQSLIFSSAEHFKNRLMKKVIAQSNPSLLVVIDGHFVQKIDTTAASNIYSAVRSLKDVCRGMIFWNWSGQAQGAAWRLNSAFGALFRDANSLEELLRAVK